MSDLKNKIKGIQESNHMENYVILFQNFFQSDEEMKKLHFLLARSYAEMPSNLGHYQSKTQKKKIYSVKLKFSNIKYYVFLSFKYNI